MGLVPLLVVACTAPVLSDEPVDSGCDFLERPVGFEEVTEIGFSASQALAALSGTFDETLTWADGGSVPLHLELATVEPPAATLHEEICASSTTFNYLSVEVQVSFDTDDGAFDETWTVPLIVPTLGQGTADHRFAPDDLVGTHEHDPCVAPACSAPEGGVWFAFDGGTSGGLSFWGRPEDTSTDWSSVDLCSATWGQ